MFHLLPHAIGIQEVAALRGGKALLNPGANGACIFGEPGLFLMQQRYGVLDKLIHASVSPAFDVPPDHFFQFRF